MFLIGQVRMLNLKFKICSYILDDVQLYRISVCFYFQL